MASLIKFIFAQAQVKYWEQLIFKSAIFHLIYLITKIIILISSIEMPTSIFFHYCFLVSPYPTPLYHSNDHSCTLCHPPVIFVDKSFVDSSFALSIDDIRVMTSHQRSKKLTKAGLDFYRLKQVQSEENRVN